MTEKAMPAIRPTVGYDAQGRAQTFDLEPGEKLPEGFSDKPPPGAHPHDKDGTNPRQQARNPVPPREPPKK